MQYAVISDRGKQYTVKPGERVRVDHRDEKPGDKVVFDHVLLVGGEGDPESGAPEVAGARVEGTVLAHGRGKKLIVFKIRRRKGYRRKQGHRQGYTDVRIDSVAGSNGKASTHSAAAEKPAKAPKAPQAPKTPKAGKAGA